MWETLHGLSDPLAWVAIGGFVCALGFHRFDRPILAARVGGASWGAFGLFWLAMFPYFYFDFGSPLESILSLAAVPLCLYTGYLLAAGRTSLLLLTKAVAIMGMIYLPVMMLAPVERFLIETVATQTHLGMELLGYSPGLETGPNGYESRFGFSGYTTYIVLACTGIGSIAIFGGLIAATTAPIRRKLLGVGVAVGIIWILNIARNVFVGLAAPLRWFNRAPFESITELLVGSGIHTSFFVAHHLISQTLAVVALVGIAMIVIKIVPEVLDVLNEALFVVTGSEWELREAIGGIDPETSR